MKLERYCFKDMDSKEDFKEYVYFETVTLKDLFEIETKKTYSSLQSLVRFDSFDGFNASAWFDLGDKKEKICSLKILERGSKLYDYYVSLFDKFRTGVMYVLNSNSPNEKKIVQLRNGLQTPRFIAILNLSRKFKRRQIVLPEDFFISSLPCMSDGRHLFYRDPNNLFISTPTQAQLENLKENLFGFVDRGTFIINLDYLISNFSITLNAESLLSYFLDWNFLKEIQSVNRRKVISAFVRIFPHEFNFSNNPTYSNRGTMTIDTREPFSYITSIGLYNDMNELLGVAKLSKPIKKTNKDSFVFRIDLDVEQGD